MKVFLDTNVIVSALASDRGSPHDTIELILARDWCGIVTPYLVDEVDSNLHKLPDPAAAVKWAVLRERLVVLEDVLTFPWPVVFEASKDKPVLFGAASHAGVLLTLDRKDFSPVFGGRFYDLPVMTPGEFLRGLRATGVLD